MRSNESTISPNALRPQPVRTCVGCRRREARTDLLRIVAVVDGTTSVLTPDPRGSAAGRGAHLHPTVACLDLALRRKAFLRALRITGPCDTEPVRHHLESHIAAQNA